MIDEGTAISVATPEAARRRRLPVWALVLGAPIVAELSTVVSDQVLFFFRAHRFGAPFGFYRALPVVGFHLSFIALVLSGVTVLAVVARQATWRAAALAAVLVLPLGFGTARAEVKRLRAPAVLRSIAMAPACVSEGGGVTQDGHSFDVDRAAKVALDGSHARWDEGTSEIILYASGAAGDGVARLTTTLAARSETRCGYGALLVDGDVAWVARVEIPLLWGSLAFADARGDARLRTLFDRLTSPAHASGAASL